MKISAVLNALLHHNAITESELARKVNLPRATINRLTSGKTPDPRASTLALIAQYFKISVDQLLGKEPFSMHPKEKKDFSIPLIPFHACPEWKEIINEPKNKKISEWIPVDLPMKEGHFAVHLKGDAMSPQFQENTLLIASTQRVAKNRDFVIAFLKELGETVFRQLVTDGKLFFLKASNDIFPTIPLSEDDQVLAVIVQSRKVF